MFLDLLREFRRMLPRREDNDYLRKYGKKWYHKYGWNSGQHWHDDPEERWLYFKSNSRMMLRKIWPYPSESMPFEEAQEFTTSQGTKFLASPSVARDFLSRKRPTDG